MDDAECNGTTEAMQAMSLDDKGEFEAAFLDYSTQANPAADDPFANQMQMTSAMFPDGIPQPDDFAAYAPDVMGGNDGSNAAQDYVITHWTAGGDWVQPVAPPSAPSTSGTLATHNWTTGATWTNAETHTIAQTFDSATIAYSVTDDFARQEPYNPPTEYTTGPFIPLSHNMSLRITATAGGEKGLKLKDSLSIDHDLTGDVLIEALRTLCAMYKCTEQMNQTIESSKNVIRHSRALREQRHAWRKVYRNVEGCRQNVAQIDEYLAGTQSQADLTRLMRPLVKHLYRTHQNAVADEGGTFEDLWLYCGVHCTCPNWSDEPQLLHARDQQS